ncbi:hypothetical protein E3P99_01961 [Wallemia hederae]|uniref:Zn(2)-C6 fungal-type domain-containing protein n=1 Tax=Wallemia hederae TaxID=1540922 RepID=A0A4T0FM21_9BASI|nr:hypothetical protein E3P99_01961 [Wallemia hederae]
MSYANAAHDTDNHTQQKRRYGDSCEQCRRRKRKCDAHEAPCAQCLKSGYECVFPATAAPARLARTINELDYHKDFISKLAAANDDERAELLGDWSRKHLSNNAAASTSANNGNGNGNGNGRRKRRKTDDRGRPENGITVKSEPSEPSSPTKFKHNAASHLHYNANESLPLTNVPPDRTEMLVSSVLGSQALSPTSQNLVHEQYTPSQRQSQLLLTTYFCWQCPQHLTITKSLFLRDMKNGGGPWYSPFLLNALYAHASRHLSTIEAGGDYAFKARVYLAGELDKPSSIPTIQGLLILGGRDCALGRISQGFILAGIAFRMISDLGIDREDESALSSFSHEERTVHRRVVWSAYTWDKLISLVLGRAPTFPKPPCPLPQYHDDTDNEDSWAPIFLEDDGPPQAANYPHALAHESLTFENSCKLWMIIEDILTTVYVTRAPFEECNQFVSNTHKQLQTYMWTLPGSISLDVRALPAICPPVHILTLNLLTRTTWILLYRPYTLASPTPPFSNTPFPDSIDICRRNAAEINALFGLHERSFGLCNMTYLMTYCAYVSATIDLAELLSNDPVRSHDAKERLVLTFHVLAKGAEYTPGLQRSIALLRQRYLQKTQQQAEAQEAASSGQAGSVHRPRATDTGIHHTPPASHTALPGPIIKADPVVSSASASMVPPTASTTTSTTGTANLPTPADDELDLDGWFSAMTNSSLGDMYLDGTDLGLQNFFAASTTSASGSTPQPHTQQQQQQPQLQPQSHQQQQQQHPQHNQHHNPALLPSTPYADFFDMSLATFDSLHGSLAAFPSSTQEQQ